MGTPTYIPQNGPHDALITLNIQTWGIGFFQKTSFPPIGIGQSQTKLALGLGTPFSDPPPPILGLESPPPPPRLQSKFLVALSPPATGLTRAQDPIAFPAGRLNTRASGSAVRAGTIVELQAGRLVLGPQLHVGRCGALTRVRR